MRAFGTLGMLAVLASTAMASEPITPPPSKPAMSGEFTRLATVAHFQGHVMKPAQRAAFLKQNDPDRIVAAFPGAQRQQLALLGLEIGFDAIRLARTQPGIPVPLPEKDAELVFRWLPIRTPFDGVVYRPLVTVRLVRLKATPGVAGGGMGVLPPGGVPGLPPIPPPPR